MSSAYPHLRLDLDALDHNIAMMAAWCDERGVALAPHVKTTMSEPIIARQLAAGAVGVTVATVDQVAAVLSWGSRRVLVANQVVDRMGLERLRRWLEEDPAREIRCLVDSEAGVRAAAAVFPSGGCVLEVLIDVGTPGGRTGVRESSAAVGLASLVAAAPGLRLVGVSGYEGVVPNSRDADTLAAVDRHCHLTRGVYLELARFFETDEPVYSMGGSAFPDRVVEFLPDLPGTTALLRSGCYVTHDHGTYAGVSPVLGLTPALSVRAVVISAPEPGLVVLGAGKRDLPYDAGLPTLLSARSEDGEEKPQPTAVVSRLFDHHAVLTGADGLEVTDLVDLGISHPCSAFDRWPEFLVVDRDGEVLDVWHTDFHRSGLGQQP